VELASPTVQGQRRTEEESYIFACEIRFDWLTVLSAVKGRDTFPDERMPEQVRHDPS